MITLTKSKLIPIILFTCFLLIHFSCQKELSGVNIPGGSGGTVPDLTTKVSSSVSGFVTDENNTPVIGAAVAAGDVTTTTDKYGYFQFKNIQVVKDAAVVTVSNPGYFKGIKTYIGVANKSAFFRIKLIPKTTAGTINAAAGGNVTLSNGLIVNLPANAVVTASGNAAYTGTINVALKYIDPTAKNVNQVMPGDLRGLTTDGTLKALTSYGMAAVELTGNSGELLQIAGGKKATLTMPLPASLLSTAPATIPLWYFDETKGLWKQEGTATKTGNTYVGDVAHFSFWNCDVPNNYVHFDCTLLDPSGQPIHNALVVIYVVGAPYWASGVTDQSGYVGGAVPDNAQLRMEVYSGYGCTGLLYSQNFSTTNSDISFGNITINVPSHTANISGTITDCNNTPLSNGSIVLLIGNEYSRYTASASGTYNFSLLMCSGSNSTAATFVGENTAAGVQGTPLNYTISVGNNVVPNLQACGTATQEFLTFTDNGGTPVTLTMPVDTITQYGQGNINYVRSIQAVTFKYLDFNFENSGIAVGSTQNINNIYSSVFNPSSTITITTPAGVHITEYGSVGQFIAGNFSINVSESTTPATTHDITCNFRVRRTF